MRRTLLWCGVLLAASTGCDSIIKGDKAPTCEDACDTLGEKRCSGPEGQQECIEGAEGCRVWSDVTACPDPDPSPCIGASCNAGACGAANSGAIACTDGRSCTKNDTCEAGACKGQVNHPECDDQSWCNGQEQCVPDSEQADAETGCIPGAAPEPPEDEAPTDCMVVGACDEDADAYALVPASPGAGCDDGLECTTADACDDAGGCAGETQDAFCDDGSYCSGVETCVVGVGCQKGTPVPTDDGIGCTVDVCDDVEETVHHTPLDDQCDDGVFCNGAETCDAEADCQKGIAPVVSDGVACTVDACDEEAGEVTHTPDDSACDDDLWCNGAETCNGLAGCQDGLAPSLDDGVACTVDSCDEESDEVHHLATDAECDDDDFCNGTETCDQKNGCQDGEPPPLDDGFACTVDVCDTLAATVVHTPDDGACDDSQWCNGAETCAPGADGAGEDGCVAGQAPEPPVDEAPDDCMIPGPCDEDGDGYPLIPLSADADCDDGVACTAADACDDTGTCAGDADDLACEDGSVCTADACNPSIGCVSVAAPGPCDDGQPCTVDDACDASSCVGQSLDCEDGDPCTADLCDPAVGCTHAPLCTAACGCVSTCPPSADGVACDDGNPETVADFCLAGQCGGFVETVLTGGDFGAMTVADLNSFEGTLWAVGNSMGSGTPTSWLAPVLPGVGLAHLASNDVTAVLDESSHGVAVGGLTVRVLHDGVWRFDAELGAAINAVAPFGDFAAVWGTARSDGGREYWLVGRTNTFDAARFARCVRKPPGADPLWTCTNYGLVYPPNPAVVPGLVGSLFPQTVLGFATDGVVDHVVTHGVSKDSKGDFKYTMSAITPSVLPEPTDVTFLGGFFGVAGTGFFYDSSGISTAEGEVWAAGKGGFLGTTQVDAPTVWSWKSAAVQSQLSSANFRALTTVEAGTLAVDHRLNVLPSGATVFTQLLHTHPTGTHFNTWLPVTIERRSSACVAETCAPDVVDSFSLDTVAGVTGRLVLAGAGFDYATATPTTRILERTMDGDCPGTLVSASFDDGGLGTLVPESGDEDVAWHPAPTWTPPGASGPLRGTLYFGNPATGTYAVPGEAASGTLSTGLVLVPETGDTHAALQVWFDTEDNPDFDTLSVVLDCKGPVCPDGPSVVLFDNKTGTPEAKTWHAIEASLEGYQGSVIELRVTFDTVDAVKNDFTGFFLDGLRIVTSCPADDCSPGACDDADPCTVDACWFGRCQNAQSCDASPLAATFDQAAIVKGAPYPASIGWSSDPWTFELDPASLDGVWATVDAENFDAAPVDLALEAPPVLIEDPGEASVTFQVAFTVGTIPGSENSELRLFATPLAGGDPVLVWSMDATGGGEPDEITVALDTLSAGPWSLRFVAHLEPTMAMTWRVKR